MPSSSPELLLTASLWTLIGHPTPDAEWSMDEKLSRIRAAGFAGVTWLPNPVPDFGELLRKHGLRYAGFFDADDPAFYSEKIRACLDLDGGPMNVLFARHDTPVEEAVEKAIALMTEAKRQGASVYVEVHRNTCTETPEKTLALAEAYAARTGEALPLNFDFSHPAVVKHLDPAEYEARLLERRDLLREAKLWHFRPFNGHHCQIPVTDGRGNFSPEYRELRPFIYAVFRAWLAGGPRHPVLWVVPELGPLSSGYRLSCFADVWEDCIALGRDLQAIWNEVVAEG